MALTITAAGTGNSATSNSTLAFNCGASFAVGDMLVVVIACDNAGGGGGANTAITSVTDVQGNTYTLRLNPIYDPGAASAGIELAFFTSNITVAKITTDQITVNFNTALTAKAAVAWKVTGATAPTYVTSGAGTGAASGTPTVTTGSITSGHAVIAAIGVESNAVVTLDGDTTNGSWSAQATDTGSTGTAATSARIASQAKVVTATATQTYNPTLTSADQITGWIQIKEAVFVTATAEDPGSDTGTAYDATVAITYTTNCAAECATATGAASNTETTLITTGSGTAVATGVANNVAFPYYADSFDRTAGAPGSNWYVTTPAEWATDGTYMVKQILTDTGLCWVWPVGVDHEVEVKYQASGATDHFPNLTVRNQNPSDGSGATGQFYGISFAGNGQNTELYRKISGTVTSFGATTYALTTGVWYTLRLKVVGTLLEYYVDNVLVRTATTSHITTGQYGGFLAYNFPEYFDDFSIRPVTNCYAGTATATGTANDAGVIPWRFNDDFAIADGALSTDAAWAGTDLSSWAIASGKATMTGGAVWKLVSLDKQAPDANTMIEASVVFTNVASAYTAFVLRAPTNSQSGAAYNGYILYLFESIAWWEVRQDAVLIGSGSYTLASTTQAVVYSVYNNVSGNPVINLSLNGTALMTDYEDTAAGKITTGRYMAMAQSTTSAAIEYVYYSQVVPLTGPTTNCAAECATATGAADNASVVTLVSAGAGTSTGLATDARTDLGTATGTATSTGSADDAAASVQPSAGAAVATGSADTAPVSLLVNGDIGTATGVGNDATVTALVISNVAAGDAVATGASDNAAANIAPTVDVGSATSVAPDALVALSVAAGDGVANGVADNAASSLLTNAGTGVSTALGYDAPASLSLAAGDAVSTGAADNATVVYDRFVPGDIATATGLADNALAGISVSGGTGTATGAASDTTTLITAAADIGTSTGLGYDATVSSVVADVTAAAECATATGLAYDATTTSLAVDDAPATDGIATGQAYNATAVEAAIAAAFDGVATGAAFFPGIASNTNSDLATATSAAFDTTTTVVTNAGTAVATGLSDNAAAVLLTNASDGIATGQGWDAVVTTAVVGTADIAISTGAAFNTTTLITTAADIATAVGIAEDAVILSGALAVAEAAVGTGSADNATTTVVFTAGTATATGAADNAAVSIQVVSQDPSASVITDAFVRADSTTTMGSTDTGQSWVPNSGTWGITGNRAYSVTSTSQATTVVESGASDCTISVQMIQVSDAGLCYRSTDDNNNYVVNSLTGTVYKKTAGSYSQVGVAGGAFSNNDTMTIVLSGSSHILKRNGVQVTSFTDAHNQTATKHGLRSHSSTITRFADFSITSGVGAAGVANNAAVSLVAAAGTATAIGLADNASVITAVVAVAGIATATGLAEDATTAVLAADDAPAEDASASGVANHASISTYNLVMPSDAVGSGTANDAGVITGVFVAAGQAVATGTASDTPVSLATAPSLCSATGVGWDSAALITTTGLQTATATSVAYDASVVALGTAQAAQATGTAFDASVNSTVFIEAFGGTTSATAVALDATITLTLVGATATASGTAFDADTTALRMRHSYWNGTAWVHGSLSTWDGQHWVESVGDEYALPVRVWTGEAWRYASEQQLPTVVESTPSRMGAARRWNGTEWVRGDLREWDGTAWRWADEEVTV